MSEWVRGSMMSLLKEMKSIFSKFQLWFKAPSGIAENKTMLILAMAHWRHCQTKAVIHRPGETAQTINPHFGDGHWGVTSWLPQDRTGSNTGQRWRRGIVIHLWGKKSVQIQSWPSRCSSSLTWLALLPKCEANIAQVITSKDLLILLDTLPAQ